MKNALIKFSIIGLLVTILAFNLLNVSALKYVENVVEDYENSEECKFLQPGDLDANGTVNASDIVKMRGLLVGHSEDDKYSDVNGDDLLNLKDLIRQKKNASNSFNFLSNGVINLNGNSAYSGEFISLLGEGASYKLSYKYKSETPIKVVISGLDKDIVFESNASSNQREASYTFKTPLTISETDDIELKIIGVGEIDEFTVTRVNMDNEVIEDW